MTRLSWHTVSSGATLIAVLTLLCHVANGRYELIEPVASARDTLAPTPVERSKLQLLSVYEILEERPLFSSTRRPRPLKIQPDPTTMVPQPPPALPTPILLGTMISPERRAAFVRVDGGRTVTVAEGGAVAGWTLDQVQPGEAMFRLEAKVIPVKMSRSSARQDTAATSLVADTSAMPMRSRGGWLGKP